MPSHSEQLLDTRRAFDSVAADYDGPRGNNALIQDMRAEVWEWLDAAFPKSSRLMELGCGTGIDAVRMAGRGHSLTATDWSEAMVARTRDRVGQAGLSARVTSLAIGAHELQRLEGANRFDGAYSCFGPLNCVPNLDSVANECARLLRPGGVLLFTVIGRICPWELIHYAFQRRWKRACIRFARTMVPVGMNRQIIWTRYYTPREFFRPFASRFNLQHHRGLCLFAPPPYLGSIRERHPHRYRRLQRLDRTMAGWPVLRAMGDHFLIRMIKR